MFRKKLSFLISAEFYRRLAFAAAAVMAVCLSFSFALFNVCIVIVIVCFFMRRILDRDISSQDPLMDFFTVCFFLAGGLSLIKTQYLGMSLQGLQKLGRYLLLFFASREIVTGPKSLRGITAFFLVGGTLAGFDAVSQLIIGRDFILGRTPFLSMDDLIRVSGSFNNPNALAIYLCFLIPLTFQLIFSGPKKYGWLIVPGAGMLIAVVFTYSRPAALALAVSFLLIALMNRAYWLFIAAAVAAGAGLLLAPPAVKQWIQGLGSIQGFFSDTSRHFHHLAAWNMIAHSPLFGVGINTFDVNYAYFRAPGDPITRWSAHQAYLQVWAEMGICGIGSFLLMVFRMFNRGWHAYRFCKEEWLRKILMGYAAGVLGFLVISFFESSLWQPRQTYFFWFFAGVWCGIIKWVRDHETVS